MRRSLLDHKIKKIHPALRVVRYSNRGEHIYHGGNDALYFYTNCVGAIPVGNIYLRPSEQYRGSKYRNRSLLGIINRLRAKGIIYGRKYRKAYYDITK